MATGTEKIRVGDFVTFQFGTGKVAGVVREDRGPIGIKGRRLYLIDFSTDPENVSQIELPAELLDKTYVWAVLDLTRAGPAMASNHNLSSVTYDGGPGCALILTFTHSFPDDLYECQVMANRDVSFRVQKSPGSVHIVIDEPVPQRVKIVCYEP